MEKKLRVFIERYRDLGNLSTEYDLGILPWGTYSIEANAYICRYTDISICIDDDDYILTHKFSNPALVIGSGYENYEIDLGMDVNYTTSGTVKSGVALDQLDPNIIKITPNIDFSRKPLIWFDGKRYGQFCL